MKKATIISSYKILNSMGQSLYAEAFRVCPIKDINRILSLKLIKCRNYSEDFYLYLQNNINSLNSLNIKGAIHPLSCSKTGVPFLVQEYFDGINLGEWMRKKHDIPLHDFFKIALSIISILNMSHNAGIIHGGIKPNNILINLDTLDIRLIDYIKIFDLDKIDFYVLDNNFKRNTLRYLSPEQTEQIERGLDNSTDLYSLGIIFYEMLSGSLPFLSNDPFEIIHSIITEELEPLNKINKDIPDILSDIVGKLIEKDPDKRYQTAQGLLFDLEYCQTKYLHSDTITKFTLGREDYKIGLKRPLTLFGREDETRQLITEHAKSCLGYFRGAIISGESGTGKTSLAKELRLPVASAHGYFAFGKFEQFRNNFSYGAFVQALEKIISKILTEENDKIEYWKKTINKAIGINAGLIIDLVPELKAITGHVPDIPPMPPVEAKNRFKMTVQRLLSCLASHNHPITFFIDDLQWGDKESFELLEYMFDNADNYQYLYIVLAYRSNNVDENHLLNRFIKRIKKSDTSILKLNIKNLDKHHTGEMISNMLDNDARRTKTITNIIYTMSEGNPFYITEILSWLDGNRLLYFDNNGNYSWDEEQIRIVDIPDSGTLLIQEKLKKLPEEIFNILKIAACIGLDFKIKDLSLIFDKSIESLYNILLPAIDSGFLIKSGNNFSFIHDKVREVVYRSLEIEQRQKIHSSIADAYIDNVQDKSKFDGFDNIFDVAMHINQGINAHSCRKICYRNALINNIAGKKAIAAAAFDSANRYFKAAFEFLPENSWDDDHALTYSIIKNLALNEITLGNQQNAEKNFNEILTNLKDKFDYAEIMIEESMLFSSLGEFKKSILYATKALSTLGIVITEDIEEIKIQTNELLKKWSANDLTDNILNNLEDRKNILILRSYNQMLPSFYGLGRIEEFFLTGLSAYYYFKNISERYQYLLVYPLSICSMFFRNTGAYETAYELEKTTLDLLNKFPFSFEASRGGINMLWSVFHWTRSTSYIKKMAEKNIKNSMNCGDMFYASLGRIVIFWVYFIEGRDFFSLKKFVDDAGDKAKTYNINACYEGTICHDMGAVQPMLDWSFVPDIKELLDELRQTNNFTVIANYYVPYALNLYYLDEQVLCYNILLDGKKFLSGVASTILEWLWHVVYVLNGFKRLSAESIPTEREEILNTLGPVIKNIELWADSGPLLRPYLAFIRAEEAGLFSGFSEARRLYLDAIDLAFEQGYILLNAHIHEALASFLIEHENRQAAYHIHEAVEFYTKSGAHAKLVLIKKKYPQFFLLKAEPDGKILEQQPDITYLMKAAQTISRELDSEKLLHVIVKMVMKGTGARKGCFLTGTPEDIIIRARGLKYKTFEIMVNDEPLSAASDLSQSVIRYVMRTKETLILDNAIEEGPFIADNEVQALKIRSVLCQPILKGDVLLGVLYLQNNIMKSVFTPQDVETVKAIATHAGIAIENSRLVQEMQGVERALHESEELYKTLIENMDLGIVLIDPHFNVLMLNKKQADFYNICREEAIGEKCFNLFEKTKNICSHCPAAMAMENSRTEIMESEIQKDDRNTVNIRLMAFPVQADNGKIKGVISVMEDITAQKNSEKEKKNLAKQLIHAQKMEAVGTLAGGIAHDFNNLLMGIQGNTSLLLLKMKFSDPSYSKLKNIEKCVQSGSELTRQLLGFARGGKYNIKAIDINELVNKTSSMFGRTEKEININKKLKKGLWLVDVDQGQIEQVLMNLYVNAWQAMADGGEIYIKTKNIELDKSKAELLNLKSGKYIELSVADTGIGMDEATRQKIFDPFFTTKDMNRGTGLGLASAYGIMKNHAGMITVSSEVGLGSTFNIYLPASDKLQVDEEFYDMHIHKGKETILLVDDEDIFVDAAGEMLREIGYEVFTAKDGEKAILIYKKKKDEIDLVILDMIMPGMDGGKVYNVLKEINPSVKALLSSGYSLAGKAGETLALGFNGFIQKPFNIQKLSIKIREVLDKIDCKD